MRHLTLILATVLLGQGLLGVTSHRILGIFPHGGKSHFHMFGILMEGLAKRGHDVVVLSAFPRQTPLKHYTDISLADAVPILSNELELNSTMYKVGDDNVFFTVGMLITFGLETCDKVLSLPRVKELVNSKFDVVLYELFNTECSLGLVSQIDAPHIAVSSSAMMPWHNERFGNLDNPSYIPLHFLPHSDHMTYYQRLKNTFYYEGVKWIDYYANYIPTMKIVRKHLGDQVPCLKQVAKETSLLLLNTHPTINLPHPHVPAIIEVGGLHIQDSLTALPKDIEKFLNEAKDGVIYFSFGSLVRASTLPEGIRRELVAAFSELPQRVLWKWEEDLPDKPDNVMVQKWMPQIAVLKHPKVRAFITHGGLMGLMEAVSAGVPMLAVPLFGDQPKNVAAVVENQVAIKLPFDQLQKDNILRVLKRLLNEPSYAENARRLASAFNDRPLSALDTAVYWTEYVIKHRGASLLRLASVDLAWYQYYLLDVIPPFIAAFLVIIAIMYLMVKSFLRFVFSCLFGKSKKSKEKSQPKTKSAKGKKHQ